MTFRQRPPLPKRTDPWSQTLRDHASLADQCGVPREILEDSTRFHVSMEHGYDETAWFEDQKARTQGRIVDVFSTKSLTNGQRRALARLARALLGDDRYRERILSDWYRA